MTTAEKSRPGLETKAAENKTPASIPTADARRALKPARRVPGAALIIEAGAG